jgi:DNA-binding phage protein
MTLDEMRRRLEPMNLREVSRQTGVHQNLLYRIKSGGSPNMRTFERIRAWLESQS